MPCYEFKKLCYSYWELPFHNIATTSSKIILSPSGGSERDYEIPQPPKTQSEPIKT